MLADVQMILQILIWFLAIVLILLILVQGGSGDLSSTFGGGGQLDSSLGVGASRKMGKITGWLSFMFLMVVLVMAIPAGGSFAETGTGSAALGDDAEQLAPTDAEPAPLNVEALPVEPAQPAAEATESTDPESTDPESAEIEAANDVSSEAVAADESPSLEIAPDQEAAEADAPAQEETLELDVEAEAEEK